MRTLLAGLIILIGTKVLAQAVACHGLFWSADLAAPLNPAKGEINYKLLGKKGRPVVVLIHGMGGDLHSWDDIAPELKSEFQVLVVDLRGHGKTLARGTDYSTATLAGDVNALLNYLKIDKAFIVGHSMGARVAARFAVAYADKVQALVVEDMDLIRRTSGNPETLRRIQLKNVELRARLQKKYRSPEDYLLAIQPFFNEPDFAGISEMLKRDRSGHWHIPVFPPDVFHLYWNQGNRDDILTELAKTNVHTLMLRADTAHFNSAMTDEGVRRTRQLMPSAQILTVIEAEHSIHGSQPGAYLQILRNFLLRPI